jgi:hypothetical protein
MAIFSIWMPAKNKLAERSEDDDENKTSDGDNPEKDREKIE